MGEGPVSRGTFLDRMDRAAIAGAFSTLPQRWRDGRDDFLTAATAGWSTARTWRLTQTEQVLPRWTFHHESANRIDRAHPSDRLYCIYRRDWEVRAAVAFDAGSGPAGSILLTELALARVAGTSDEVDVYALGAAVLLLDRLHDLAVTHELPTELWALDCWGCTDDQFDSLDFRAGGTVDGASAWVRYDPEDRLGHPGRGLELLRAWHRMRTRQR